MSDDDDDGGPRGSKGNYRLFAAVGDTRSVDGAERNGYEMKTATQPGEEGEGSSSTLPRVDSADVLNLTLHQCSRDGDLSSAETIINYLRENDRLGKQINKHDENKLTPLHYAARYGHTNIIRLLVETGADVNKKGEDGAAPLHYAAKAKRERQRKLRSNENTPSEETTTTPGDGFENQEESAVHHLVKSGALITIQDQYGSTPLHYAAMRGNEVAARELLSFTDQVEVEKMDKTNMTALHVAATYSQIEIVQLLINANAQLRCKDDEDGTPLHSACTKGSLKIVEMLFEAAAKENEWVTIRDMVSDRNIDGSTALHLAVENGHYEVAKLCLDRGADVNCPMKDRSMALHLAAINGSLENVKLLLERNARIDALNNNQETPLHKAASLNHEEVVKHLLQNGARINKRDKDNYTPLLLAACNGHVETIELLMEAGADYTAVDKSDKTAIYMAAEENQLEALEKLLSYPNVKQMINISDRYCSEPLHIAAKKGYLEVVKCLLQNNAHKDAKNDEEQTPLHLAASYGRTNVVRELVKQDKSVVNDEDENSDTALHLAALNGHDMVTNVLIKMGADVCALNCNIWTPLDCAAAKGWVDTAKLLLEDDSPVDPADKSKTTPLHLACRFGHSAMVVLLLQWNASITQRDSDGNNCLDIAIDNNNNEVALILIKSDRWEDALKNETFNLSTGFRDTPMRKLIRKMPDVAERVFEKCLTSRGNPESMDYTITFLYEFLDDTYTNWKEKGASSDGSSSSGFYDEKDMSVLPDIDPYSYSTTILKENHPLHIMVKSARDDLLAHPLVTSLLNRKWETFGGYFYYLNFLIYSIFLMFLTGYICTSKPPYIRNLSGMTNLTGKDACEELHNLSLSQHIFAKIGKYVIIVLSAWNLLREIFQIYQARLDYLGFENLIEWVTYVTALLHVIDFDECQRLTGFRFDWQWSLGAVAVFFAWMDLVLFVRKFPRFGIYVVMFTDVFHTFLQFCLVFLLFIVAFALGFYTLIQNQDPFSTVEKSLLKTSVMMIGEFDYNDIFNSNEKVFYGGLTYALFVTFLILMSIIIMNLLVGLAVDDIKAVQEQAALKRLAMKVSLVLDVEKFLPHFLRRRFTVKSETKHPNKRISNPLWRLLKVGESSLQSSAVYKVLNPELDEIKRLRIKQKSMNYQVIKVKKHMKELRAQNCRLESMLLALVKQQGVAWEEEDYQDEDGA